MSVQEAADIKVLLICRIAIFAVFQNVIKDDRRQFFVDRREVDFDVADLVLDLFFFVGQEHVFVFDPCNQHFPFQLVQACFNATAQIDFISIDFINGKGDQIIECTFQHIDIADQEQRFQ